MPSDRVLFSCTFSLWAFSMVFATWPAFAHKGVDHTAPLKAQPTPEKSEMDKLQKINNSYRTKIKGSLIRACGDCHSDSTEFLWYSDLPVIQGIIRNDIAQAKEHLDLSNDFPFKGHGKPIEDLEAIEASIKEGSMPPWNYRLLHPKKSLSDQEKQTIQRWIENSLNELRK